jgi:hypothetical protein
MTHGVMKEPDLQLPGKYAEMIGDLHGTLL